MAEPDPIGLFSPEELEVEDAASDPVPEPPVQPPARPALRQAPRPVVGAADVRIYVAEQLGHALRLHAGLRSSLAYLDPQAFDEDQAEAVSAAGRGALDAARDLYLALAKLTNAFGLPQHGDPL